MTTIRADTPTESIPLWAAAARSRFEAAIAVCSPFEAKGILHSEMLAFCGALEGLGIEHVIESGRARGQSTEVIARFIGDRPIAFDSIEYDSESADVSVAERRLAAFPDVHLHYGDSLEILPSFISEKRTAIIIDGPKGFDALRLAVATAQFSEVKLVAIHDVHRGDEGLRAAIASTFPQAWFTDDKAHLRAHAEIDADCWQAYQAWPETSGYAPYRRGTIEMESYGPTLCLIRDPALSAEKRRTALARIEYAMRQRQQRGWLFRTLARILPAKLKSTALYAKARHGIFKAINKS